MLTKGSGKSQFNKSEQQVIMETAPRRGKDVAHSVAQNGCLVHTSSDSLSRTLNIYVSLLIVACLAGCLASPTGPACLAST